MTEPERRALRALIDQERRARLPLECAHCGEELAPHPYGQPKRFCSPRCRRDHWQKTTARGREMTLAKKRRYHARRREQAA